MMGMDDLLELIYSFIHSFIHSSIHSLTNVLLVYCLDAPTAVNEDGDGRPVGVSPEDSRVKLWL